MYYLLQAKTLPISDTGVGLSVSWPTPRARDHFPPVSEENVSKNSQGYSTTRKKSGVKYGASLPDAVNYENKMWPTPTHMNDSIYVDRSPNRHKRHSRGLASEVDHRNKMWPTPRSRDYKDGSSIPPSRKKNPELATLGQKVLMQNQMFLTPSANEDAAGRVGGKMQKMLGNSPEVRNTGKGTLSAEWVELLMGYPKGWTDIGEMDGKKVRQELPKGKKTEPTDLKD
jgi:hypothetical protein